MRFFVDEDVAVEIVRALKQRGHEVSRVTIVLGRQTDDLDVWRYAVNMDAIVITCNRQDFLRLAGMSPETGVIIVNRRRTRQSECRHVLELIAKAGEAGLRNNINFA